VFRRVHLAHDARGLTACGLIVARLGEAHWRPTWALVPRPWRCARCKRVIAGRRATRAPMGWFRR
jgi:hypothetical protein